MPEWITTLGFAMGSAWLSGINLYATVATLGLLQRYHLASLPGNLNILSNWWVIGIACGLYVIEFVADKVPYVDSVWDVVHTFIRVPAGAALAFAAFSNADPAVKTIAMLLGGGIALTSHGAKAATRIAANTSPEPFSNVGLSVLEDIFTFAASFLVAWFPLIVLGMVVIFLVMMFWLGPKVARALRSLFRRNDNRLSQVVR